MANTKGSQNDSRDSFLGIGGAAGRIVTTLGALALVLICPPLLISVVFVNRDFEGSFYAYGSFIKENGLAELWSIWPQPNLDAFKIFGAFGLMQWLLLTLVPCKPFIGPLTPKCNRPRYQANGVACQLITIAILGLLYKFDVFNPKVVIDLLPEIIATSNVVNLGLCVYLTVKGLLAPTTTDSGSTGNLVFDFFWGTELHPRISLPFGLDFDIKQFTNCRMGMMGWQVIVLCSAVRQYEEYGFLSNSMFVCAALQTVYIFKFFIWETGYFCTMDIQHDRAGFYICWGCLVCVPSLYTIPATYYSYYPVQFDNVVALLLLWAGVISIWINYDVDRQRQLFRKSDGKVNLWGRPAKYIIAKYTTETGEEKTSLLLCSGWWGVARQMRFVPEVAAAFFWSLPGASEHFLPYFYVVFLTLLLLDRVVRDEARCKSKYKQYWTEYCKQVPYHLIPYIW